MATTKTIQPTGTTITMPAMTDKPDASVFSTDVERITDAVNALDSKINTKVTGTLKSVTYSTSTTFTIENGSRVIAVTSAAPTSTHGVYIIAASTSGDVSITAVHEASVLTVSSPEKNKVTFANSFVASISVMFMILVGSIT